MSAVSIVPASTALVLIDLQRGIVAGKTVPHASMQVVERAAKLAVLAALEETRA